MQGIGQGFGRVVQVAYLVEDIDVAMQHWLAQAGLGPWTCFRNISLDAEYEGEPLTLHIHEALAYMGELQIQLVQSLDDPSLATPYQPYKDEAIPYYAPGPGAPPIGDQLPFTSQSVLKSPFQILVDWACTLGKQSKKTRNKVNKNSLLLRQSLILIVCTKMSLKMCEYILK